jgi:hypothetical protein
MKKREKLSKTSVQLPPGLLAQVTVWPGLSKSEAIRLALERASYFGSLDAEAMADLFNEYRPILDGALEDFDYRDFRTIARSLPGIVHGYWGEHRNASWKHPYDPDRSLEPSELIEKLEKLSPVARIGILDCVVARRDEQLLDHHLMNQKQHQR